MRRAGRRLGHGPTLRVHGDAHVVLFGNSASVPQDLPDANPRRTSFAATTARLSRQVSSRLGTTASSPVFISPIRAMRPARQPSARQSPLAHTSPSQPPPDNHGLAAVSAVASAEAGPNAAPRASSGSVQRHLDTSNSTQSDLDAPKQPSSFRLKAKRSFRNLFFRRENTPAEARPASAETSRSSIASAGRNLAKRISKNFSKEDSPVVPTVPEAELQNLEELTREQLVQRPAQTPARVPTPIPTPAVSATPPPAPAAVSAPLPVSRDPAAIHPETSRIVTEMVERGGTMPAEARDTTLALEIGEAVIQVSERASNAILSNKQAQEHAEEAKKQMDGVMQANTGLTALMRLDFDDPVLQELKSQLQGSPFLANDALVRGGQTRSSEATAQ
ncbi:hypothetical protein IQ06DRAFT_34295 [Phaeosphaeriaceae sp. SRC1lsM3a]|nr:hypothetical protein IQ06DRAFT_34295 [Stagonospora sp. SRC1lsM3a]